MLPPQQYVDSGAATSLDEVLAFEADLPNLPPEPEEEEEEEEEQDMQVVDNRTRRRSEVDLLSFPLTPRHTRKGTLLGS